MNIPKRISLYAVPALLSALLVGLLSGCAATSTPATRTFAFLLDGDWVAEQHVAKPQVRLPAYLRQAGVVVQTDVNQIHAASYNLWAEPLEEGIMRVLRQQLARRVPATEVLTRLEVGITEFHGDLSGKVRLRGDWCLRVNGSDVRSAFSLTRTQGRSGISAMLETQLQLLEDLADQIAANDSITEHAGCYGIAAG